MTDRATLLFQATMSVSYHRRRAAFLEDVTNTLTFLTLAGGTTAFVSMFGDGTTLARVMAAGITLIGIIQTIYHPERSASEHRVWLRDWLALLAEAEKCPDPDAAQINNWVQRKYKIEGDCVGEMRALQIDCLNRACRKLNLDHSPHKLTWMQRRLMQFWSFEQALEK